MKKPIYYILIICVVAPLFMLQSCKNTSNIRIKGSDTVLPLTQKEAESYMNVHKNETLMVTGGGSGVGIAALLSGTTDIAQASRTLKLDEKQKLESANHSFNEVIVAMDALSVIVNPANKVSKLTREQLEDIFTGKTGNWKQVGGEDLKIVVYSRETSSGTYEFFKEHVLMKKNFASSALLMPATGAIVQSVSQTKGAIGYIGLAYITSSVKPIDISYDKGATYVTPSVENAKNKTYPITRPLYYYYLKSSEKLVQPYVNYVLSEEGQGIVAKTGFIPVR